MSSNTKTVSDISNAVNVANIFNNFFIDVAKYLSEPNAMSDMTSEDIIEHYTDHESIKVIKSHCVDNILFEFQGVSHVQVLSKLKSLDVNKSVGYDMIPARLPKTRCRSVVLYIQD